MAIIRIEKINETKKALSDAGIPAFSASGRVFGRGKGNYDAKVLDGVKQGIPEALSQMGPEPRLRAHRLITVAVSDKQVKSTIESLIKANKTETPGDGKIFVLPLNDTVRVRTGENGETVI